MHNKTRDDNDTVRFSVVISRNTYQRLNQLARRDLRTRAGYIRKVLTDAAHELDLEDNGAACDE